jgi:hypothetical protein
MKVKECVNFTLPHGWILVCPHKEISGKLCSACKLPDKKHKLVYKDGSLPRLEITDASKELHHYVCGIVNDNYMDSKIYHLTREAGIFFQGGYNDPEGGWILLEFWKDPNKALEIVEMINNFTEI